MKKIKFYFLGLIALAIVVITSTGLGVKVEAAENVEAKTYSYRAEDLWGSYSLGDNKPLVPKGIISGSGNHRYNIIGEYAKTAQVTVSNLDKYKATPYNFTHEAAAGGSRTMTIGIGDTQDATLTMYYYNAAKAANNLKLTLFSGDTDTIAIAADADIHSFTYSFTGTL